MSGSSPSDFYNDYWVGTSGWTPRFILSERKRELFARVVPRRAIILDVGCGDGAHYGQVLAQGAQAYHGLDVSDIAVEKARCNGILAQQHDLQTPFPFADGVFDVVICIEVMEHLFSPAYALREMRRVLKPDGVIVISVPNIAQVFNRVRAVLGGFAPGGSPETSSRRPWDDPHIRFFTARSLRLFAAEQALRVSELHGENFSPFNMMPVLSPLMARVVGWERLAAWSRPFEFVARLRPSVFAGNLIAVLRTTEIPQSSSASAR